MKMLYRALGALLVATILAACQTTTPEISFVAYKGQSLYYRDGHQVVTSGENGEVKALLVTPGVGRIEVLIQANNHFDVAQNMSPRMLVAGYVVPGQQGTVPLKVYSHQELRAELEKRQKWATFGAAMGAMGNSMNAANAGTSTTYGTISGDVNGTYTGTTYDSAAASAAQSRANAENAQNIAALRSQQSSEMNQLETQYMQDHTIFPGESYAGIVVLDAPPIKKGEGTTMLIAVPFGGEVHNLFLTFVRPN